MRAAIFPLPHTPPWHAYGQCFTFEPVLRRLMNHQVKYNIKGRYTC
jgi:hypothetical protein